jgi:hypothetical protein
MVVIPSNTLAFLTYCHDILIYNGFDKGFTIVDKLIYGVVPWATRAASRNPSRRHPTNLRLCRAAAGARLRHNPGGRARMVAAGLWSFLRCVGFEEEEGRSQQG